MRYRRMYIHLLWFVAAAVLLSASARAQNQNTVLPGPGWQVMKADWGSGNRWMDVTNQVRVLLSGNGMVQVSGATVKVKLVDLMKGRSLF